MHGDPQRRRRDDVRRECTDTDALHGSHRDEHEHAAAQPGERDALRVENGDDGDRGQVIDDCEREQERPQLRRGALSDETERGEGEGDVRGDRDRPPVHVAVADEVDRQVRERGAHHRPERGGDRQRRIAAVAQRAEDELAFDLQGDDVEEDRHQAVVHHVQQIEVQLQGADAGHRLGVPEVLVRLPARR